MGSPPGFAENATAGWHDRSDSRARHEWSGGPLELPLKSTLPPSIRSNLNSASKLLGRPLPGWQSRHGASKCRLRSRAAAQTLENGHGGGAHASRKFRGSHELRGNWVWNEDRRMPVCRPHRNPPPPSRNTAPTTHMTSAQNGHGRFLVEAIATYLARLRL